MKILAYMAQEYEMDSFEKWSKENSVDIDYCYELLTKDTVKLAKGYDGVTTQQVPPTKDEEIYSSLEEFGIKQIASRTAGVDMFDGDLARKHNVAITNVPRYSPNAIAELAVTHAMSLLRNVRHIEKAMLKGDFKWDKKVLSREIRSCVVGIVGTGRIGLTAAKLFKGLGATIIGYDAIKNPDAEGILEYKDSIEDLIKEADVISLHLPLFDSTYHIMNQERLELMKPEGILINTGRGGLVDTDALIKQLKDDKIAGAGIDVLECEPIYVNQKGCLEKIKGTCVETLMDMDNVRLTGHFAFFTETAVDNMVSTALNNVKAQLDSGELVNCTNM